MKTHRKIAIAAATYAVGFYVTFGITYNESASGANVSPTLEAFVRSSVWPLYWPARLSIWTFARPDEQPAERVIIGRGPP